MPVAKSESSLAETSAGPPAKPCPICRKPAIFATRPFCSNRCADIDLHRWLGGVYGIPVADAADAKAEDKDADKT